jgi:hypothetical protein
VVINSTTATVYTASATVTATVSGQSITRTTGDAVNTAAGGTGTATKTYVNLRISITPASAINEVTQAHTFTVTVQQKIGNGAWTAVANGTHPTVTISPAPSSKTDNCASTGTTSGVCTVVINSNTPNVYTANASVTVTVSGESITRATGDAVNTAAGGSGPATKTYVATATLGDYVWNDRNGNGVQDGGEPPISGVTLNLYANGTCAGAAQAVTTTNASGFYQFGSLLPATYCVQVASSNFSGAGVLVGYTSSPRDQGGNDLLDSDGDPTTRNSPAIVIAAGASNQTIDFGFLRLGTIGDTVFYDDNRTAAQDGAETGIQGVTVQLYANGSGSCATLGALLETKQTDVNGKYQFTNVWPGQYCVRVPETPVTNPPLTNLDRTAGSNAHFVSLITGQNYTDADFGYAGYGSIRGVVFYDWTQDGQQGVGVETGIANVQICLYADVDKNGVPDSPTALECKNTDNQGVFVFTNRLPGGYVLTESDPSGLFSSTPNMISTELIVSEGAGLSDNNNFGDLVLVRFGDFVWVDINGDGAQQPSETTGLSGVNLTVTGVNIITDPISFNVSTVNGVYLVTDMLPGTYTVTAPSVFSGYKITSAQVRSTYLTVSNTQDLTLDFGYSYPTGLEVQNFAATAYGRRVVLTWQTAELGNTTGFTLWRAKTTDGPWAPITAAPVAALGAQGNAYTFSDGDVQPGLTYWYRLQAEPGAEVVGPISVKMPAHINQLFLPALPRDR